MMLSLEIARLRKTERCRDRRARMTRSVAIVFALAALGEARKPALLTERPEAPRPAREQFVRIALMAHVKDDLILREIKHAMKRHGEFDRPEVGGKMPAARKDRRKDLLPELSADIL